MPSDLRTKYDPDMRRLAASLFERGSGFKSVATSLGLPPGTVKQWCYTYNATGLEGLLLMGSAHRKYSYEQKLAAAKAVVEDRRSVSEVMAAFGIASRSSLQAWCRAYRESGGEALRPKPKGGPKGAKAAPKASMTREGELEAEVRRLRAEVAYLKKSMALKAEKRSRTAKRPRS